MGYKKTGIVGLSGVIVLLVGLLTFMPGQAQEVDKRQDRAAVYEILGLLNQWRLEENLAPLKLNDTLTALALYQAAYVLTESPIPNGAAIHVGRNGEGIRDRAVYKQFNWPTYGRREQVQVGEIAAVRPPDEAINFWQHSPPHRATVTNAAYREIGIAAFPRGRGYLYIAVLGARPNVLPALADVQNGQLYLTAEHSQYGRYGGGILIPEQVRLFDGSGRPLSDAWQPWAETLDLPPGVGDKVYVLVTDGTTEVLSEVDLAVDVVVLPGYEPPPDPAALLVPPVTPTPTLTPEPPKPELLLVYDNRSLAVINQSRRALDLYDLELVGATMRLPMTWWLKSPGLSPDFQLFAFPAGDCALAWSFTEPTAPRKPAECRVMRAGRSQLTPDQLFWLEGSFEVQYQGQVVGTCQAAARRCEVELPG